MAYERDIIAGAAPFRATTGFRRLTTSAVDASITLAPGYHEVVNDSSVSCALRLGAAATPLPVSGAAEVTGLLVLPAGATAILEVIGSSDTVLHAALTAAGAGELYLHRVVL